MTIKITKRVVEVDLDEFKREIESICRQVEMYNKLQIGLKYPTFKRELGLKLTELEFFNICTLAGIEVQKKIIFFKQFDKQ